MASPPPFFQDPLRWRSTALVAAVGVAAAFVGTWSGWAGALLAVVGGLLLGRLLQAQLHPLRRKVLSMPGQPVPVGLPSLRQMARIVDGARERVFDTLRDLSRERDDLNGVLQGTADGVVVLGEGLRAELMNEAAHRMLGTPLDALGRPLPELVRNLELIELVEAVRGGREPEPRWIEVSHSTARRSLRVTGGRIPTADEEDRVLLVLHDVTDLKHLEQVRTDFVANVSHEMRSPLSSILGFAETLAEDAEDVGPEVADAAERILRNARRLDDIIRDLLQLSRLEHSEAREAVPTDLAGLVEDAVAPFRELATDKGMALVLDLAELPPLVEIDPDLVRQAVVNLVENAVKYTPEKGRVTVSGELDGDQVRIAVGDTGPGIPTEHQARIFERFYRVDTARSRAVGGTGLGLAIVKHAIALHGGNVTLDSAVGRGSTFSILLPLAEARLGGPPR